MEDGIVTTLRKIKVLAEEGTTEGERQAAKRKLEQLLEKHSITLDQLAEQEETAKHIFVCVDALERKLLLQVIGMVKDTHKVTTSRIYRSKKKVLVKATPLQMVEIKILFEAYRKAFAKSLDNFLTAFINANNIFPKSQSGDGEDRNLTDEELKRLKMIAMMAAGIQKTPLPRKELPG